jgi:NAD(P)-dependent dehydrogenase (short-subunit alcohol dehydrogenase family)
MTTPVTIITGGGQGIGKVTARYLMQEGYQVVIFEKDAEAGLEAAEEIDGLEFLECDVSKEDKVIRCVDETVAKYGRIDALINNAGFSINKPIDELRLEEWNRVISANLTGVFLCAKYCAPHLRSTRGSIVNLCSTRAYMSEADTEAYSASKGGIYALTHALAISLGPKVRVNAVSPGWIDVTPYQKSTVREPFELQPHHHQMHPAGRVGTPQDIARMIAFLIDPANGFITGQDFIVDGGMTRKMIYD